jgi:N-acetylneuraminate synthase
LAFSSPFDEEAVAFLEEQGCPLYKIASFELTHHPLLQAVARTKKPVIASTGMATLEELSQAVRVLREHGNRELILLKCTSAYPADPKEANLRTIPLLAQIFGVPVGLSDHTLDASLAVSAVALGATVIEKHLTLDRNEGGPDAAFSIEPHELAELCRMVRSASLALGSVSFGPQKGEALSHTHRRSLYFSRDLEVGHVICAQDLAMIRPAKGLPTYYRDTLVGAHLSVAVKRGDPVSWKHFLGMESRQ